VQRTRLADVPVDRGTALAAKLINDVRERRIAQIDRHAVVAIPDVSGGRLVLGSRAQDQRQQDSDEPRGCPEQHREKQCTAEVRSLTSPHPLIDLRRLVLCAEVALADRAITRASATLVAAGRDIEERGSTRIYYFPYRGSRGGLTMTSAARTLARVFLLAILSVSPLALAGVIDTPLPTFSDGKPSVRVYHAVGVIKGNNLQTDFICTNIDSVTVDIGVELFDETGALRNSIAANDGSFVNVTPGVTVTVGTGSTVEFHEDKFITFNSAGNAADELKNGSARVIGTSKNIACTAIIADKVHTIVDPAVSSVPPPPFTNLPLIAVP
jgi:hypothetical protein